MCTRPPIPRYDKRGGSLVTFWLSEQGLLDGIVARVDK